MKDYKVIILDRVQIDQLESYLQVAKDCINPVSYWDLERFIKVVEKQLDKQKFEHKKNLENRL